MSVLARADSATLSAALTRVPALPPHARLRGPEIGLVMVRGRAGGAGAAFNLGEMTVTRCTVMAEGCIGHCYRAGRDPDAAELAARIDAALQDASRQAHLLAEVIAPLAEQQQLRRTDTARRAAATKVEFFTMAAMRS